MSEFRHEQQPAMQNEAPKQEQPQQDAERSEKTEGVRKVNLIELGGKLDVVRSASGDLVAEHNFVKFEASETPDKEYDMAGMVVDNRTGESERYAYEYVQLPDGSLVQASLESNFSDGTKVRKERTFDDAGKVTEATTTINGKVVEKLTYGYTEDGADAGVDYETADADGKTQTQHYDKNSNQLNLQAGKKLGTVPPRVL